MCLNTTSPRTQDLVLSKEGQWRTEMCCLDTDLWGRICSSEECLLALGIVCCPPSLPCLCSGDSIGSEVGRGCQGHSGGDASAGSAFSRGKCLIIFPSHLAGLWFFSLSQNQSSHLQCERRNQSENWKPRCRL